MKRTESPESPEKLLTDLRNLVTEAEQAVSDTAGNYAEEKLADLRERFDQARAKVETLYHDAREKVVVGARRADETIRSHPYESLAIALGIGVLLGALLRRGNRD